LREAQLLASVRLAAVPYVKLESFAVTTFFGFDAFGWAAGRASGL